MAKNYQQSGGMIEVSNKGTDVIKSGSVVMVGTLAAVVIADISAGETGDGFAEGVFRLPIWMMRMLTGNQRPRGKNQQERQILHWHGSRVNRDSRIWLPGLIPAMSAITKFAIRTVPLMYLKDGSVI